MSFGGTALTMLSSISQRVLVNVLMKKVEKHDHNIWFPLRAYKNRLLARMAEMPFLYKDMKLSAKDDYVEPQMATAVDDLQRSKGNPALDCRIPLSRFHESRRAIVFGEGGFGKTTLFRHIIIRSLQQTRAKKILDGKRLVPVFVALKTVRSSSDFPLIDSICASDPYFEGERGLKRLLRLAKRKRLLLFLDGYDELPHAGGMEHIRRELETIFGKYIESRPTFFEAEKHGDLYRAIQGCRVYLSSRREFFFYSPFSFGVDVQKWIVKGLDDRRIELVEKIFDNYKQGGVSSTGVDLDPELFMQQLKRAGDDGLRDFSKSPLFLTVMCFVYVSDMRRSGVSSVFDYGARQIIKECIRLLVSELDVAKASGLTGAQKLAVINRRSSYPEEKMDFLGFFSVRLYESGMGVFERGFINSVAGEYFRSVSSSDSKDEISRGLMVSDATVNVVEQIVLSGIFVLVDRGSGVDYFDFPHRRFREVLAVSYFDDPRGAQSLKRSLLDPSYGELLLVYIEQSQYRGVLLQGMMEAVKNGVSSARVGALLVSALGRLPEEEARRNVADFLLGISAEVNVPVMPVELLDFFEGGISEELLVLEKVKGAVSNLDLRSLALWVGVGAIKKFALVEEWLSQEAYGLNFDQLRIAIYSGYRLVSGRLNSVAEQFLKKSAAGKEVSALLDMQACFYIGQDELARTYFKRFIHDLIDSSLKERVTVSEALHRELNQMYVLLGGKEKAMPGEPEGAPWTPWRR